MPSRALDSEFDQMDGLTRSRILAAAASLDGGPENLLGTHAARLSQQARAELQAMTPGERAAWVQSRRGISDSQRTDMNAARPEEALRGVRGASVIADEYRGESRRVAAGKTPTMPPMVNTVQALREERLLPDNPSAAWRSWWEQNRGSPSVAERRESYLDSRLDESETEPPESAPKSATATKDRMGAMLKRRGLF